MSVYRISYKNDVLLPGNYASYMRATRELSRLVERTKQWLKDFNEDDLRLAIGRVLCEKLNIII